jgi:hypothetical protein
MVANSFGIGEELSASRCEPKAAFAANAAMVVLVVCTRNSRRSGFKGKDPPG